MFGWGPNRKARRQWGNIKCLVRLFGGWGPTVVSWVGSNMRLRHVQSGELKTY
jgi:hypothetical protein